MDPSLENEQQAEFLKAIKLFHDNDCLEHVVLIGSWTEFLYQQTGLIPQGTTALRTLDIDFLIRNLRKPNPPVNMEALAREQGYAVDRDALLGTTKIRTASRLEIEFLIAQRGAGIEPVYRTSLGVTAQGLRGLGLLSSHTVTVTWFDIKITVPIPEAYVLHKIIINDERGKGEKREKDKDSILSIFPYLDESKYLVLLDECTIKQKNKVALFMNRFMNGDCLQKLS
ncbi:MAG: nucleotidyltransferase domain-containing protein [Clostridiales Family XIII bacterium]|nr:nucleotidyltransferase domain-containing protein [Clostridiales Family XIII bacterium]